MSTDPDDRREYIDAAIVADLANRRLRSVAREFTLEARREMDVEAADRVLRIVQARTLRQVFR